MEARRPSVLVVDDEKNILKTMGIFFETQGYETHVCSKPQDVSQVIRDIHIDLAFVDLMMTPMNGLEVLGEIKQQSPGTTVVMITAHASIDTAVEAIKKGAYHYLVKPFDMKELEVFTQKAWEHHQLSREVEELRNQLPLSGSGVMIVTRNREMLKQIDLAARIAESSISVLIEGESGTGKELLAQFIHEKSPRSDKPFVKINCAAIPEQLLESELFGHVKGAFTGASKDREGRFELADGGTVFLDEVAELSPAIQAKLLRVLQSKEFERVGESVTHKVDVRVIAATNKNLDEALKEGVFREDLFYRLNAVRIKLLPLRERPDDIPLLLQHQLKRLSKGSPPEISDDAMKALRSYRWSGNIRELENVLERALLLASNGKIELSHLPEELRQATESATDAQSIEEVEKLHIKKILQRAKDYEEAAQILGIDRATLWKKRKKYNL
ncbi:MAG: sigma-54-dependent Fis family transcriptional regulator [Ignavibacteriales bacterium]|nr:sigma-54-dependent Fis family transcriptional regulator [Ignavibacteriales bacterium]